MTRPYDPRAWFWRAADGRVFSSAAGTIVAEDDATLQAFLADGAIPTPWPRDDAGAETAAALQWVFDNAGVRVFADPVAYANAKQAALTVGGYTMTIDGVALTFATDVESRTEIMGKYLRMTQPGAPAAIRWQFASGFVSVPAARFIAAAVAIADFVQAAYDALDVVLAGIADGTITTTAAVDAAAWPSPVAPA